MNSNEVDVSIENAWVEFERVGEISHSNADNLLTAVTNIKASNDRMADEIVGFRDKHSKMSNEIAELCESLSAVNEIALLIASDIYEDSLLHDNVKLLIDIHK